MSGVEPGRGLNPDQWAAASRTTGNLAIRAGAGTGKTRSLIGHYLECLLAARGPAGEEPSPETIVAITYTNAAAGELKEGIRSKLAAERPDLLPSLDRAWISTIHSFCSRVIRTEAAMLTGEMATDPMFRLLDPDEASSLRRQAIESALNQYFSDDPDAVDTLLGTVSRRGIAARVIAAMDECDTYGLSVEALRVYVQDQGMPWEARAQAAGEAFIGLVQRSREHYDSVKRDHGVLDFSDVISRVSHLFDDPEIAARYRGQFTRILIDEFQDTNQVQFNIFKKIARNNITVVGDRNQSIYSFQGARVSVFDEALSELGGDAAKEPVVSLGVNYRSDPRILQFVNSVFSRDDLFGRDGLVLLQSPDGHERSDALTDTAVPNRVKLLPVPYLDSDTKKLVNLGRMEADWVASEFSHLNAELNVSFRDMVVVLRARTHAGVFVDALNSRGIPARVVGGKGLLKDLVVQEAMALLRVLDNPANEPDLIAALISSFGRVSDQDLVTVAQEARRLRAESSVTSDVPRSKAAEIAGSRHAAVWRACLAAAADEEYCSPELRRFVDLVSHAQSQVGAIPLAAILTTLIEQMGVEAILTAPGKDGRRNYTGEQSYANLRAFAELAGKWEEQGGSIRAFLDDVKDRVSAGDTMKVAPVPERLAAAQSKGSGSERSAEDAVSIVTIHETKGLEYPVVAYAVGSKDLKSPSHQIMCAATGSAGGPTDEVRVGLRFSLTADEIRAFSRANEGLSPIGNAPGVSAGTGRHPRYETDDFSVAERRWFESEMAEALRLHYVAATRAKELLLVSYYAGDAKPNPEKHTHYRLAAAIGEAVLDGADSAGVQAEWADVVEVVDAGARLEALLEAAASGAVASAEPASDHSIQTPVPQCDQLAGNPVKRHQRLSQLSPTHITTLEVCPWQYHLRFDRGLGTLRDRSADSPTVLGNAVHALLEQSWAETSVSSGVAARVMGAHQVDEALRPEVLGQANRVLATETLGAVRALAHAQPESQHYLQVKSDERAVHFYGIIDMYGQATDGEAMVVDYKSGKGSVSRDKYEAQARCYALIALARGASAVTARFLMPGADPEDGFESVDAGVPFHEYRFTAAEQEALESWVIDRVRLAEAASGVPPADLKAQVDVSTCMSCGYAGPLCEVGAARKRPKSGS